MSRNTSRKKTGLVTALKLPCRSGLRTGWVTHREYRRIGPYVVLSFLLLLFCVFGVVLLLKVYWKAYLALLYSKASLRQIPVLWLVLCRSGFCRTDRFQPMYFCFGIQRRQTQNLQPKQRKKLWILLFFTAKLPEKAKKIEIFFEFSKMDEEDEHSPS